jgi:glycosyltransferase involved in cell wall biosynthesis
VVADAGARLVPLRHAERGVSVGAKLAAWSQGKSELLRRRWLPEDLAGAPGRVRDGGFGCVVADTTFALPLLPEELPLLLHLHNVESDVLARRDGVGRPLAERITRGVEARLMAREEGAAARRARLTVVISELDRERIRRLAPGARVEVVENFVDLERLPMLEEGAPGDRPLLLFVGSFDYPPNREAAETLLRRHLPALRAAHPGVRVRLIGKDEDGRVTRLAREVGAEATGFVDDLVPHYREACAVYLPIVSGGGTRTKVVEAFGVGRTVLASRIGVEGLPVTPGEHYLPADTPAEGSASLARLLRGDARGVARAARKLVETRFTREAAARRFTELFVQRFRP